MGKTTLLSKVWTVVITLVMILLVEELKAGETGKFDLMLESGDGTVKDVKVVGGCGL